MELLRRQIPSKYKLAAIFILLMAGTGLLVLSRSPRALGSDSVAVGNLRLVRNGTGGQKGIDQRELYQAVRRGLQFGVPRDGYQAAASRFARMAAQAALGGTAPSLVWDFLGPMPMLGDLPNFGGVITGPALSNATGRVSALAVDPITRGRLFAGTAGGGVWMTNDGGASFIPIFDAQPSQAIGAIAVNPNTTPVTLYVQPVKETAAIPITARALSSPPIWAKAGRGWLPQASIAPPSPAWRSIPTSRLICLPP